MLGKGKTLDKILVTFNKTKTDLETFLEERDKEDQLIQSKIGVLQQDLSRVRGERQKASATLVKIKEILG